MDPASPADRDAALKALDAVIDPGTGRGLASAGLVQGLVVRDGKAGFMIEVPASAAAAYGPVREEAERVLAALPGITRAQVVLTTAVEDPATTRVRKGAKLAADPQAQPQPPVGATRPAHVKRVLAVASGKADALVNTVLNSTVMVKRNAALGQVYVPQPVLSSPSVIGINYNADEQFKSFISAWADYNRRVGNNQTWIVNGLAPFEIGLDDLPENFDLGG